MPVNQNLSSFSDIAFQTAFVVYAVALILSLIYYGRLNGVIDARRQRSEATVNAKKLKASVAAHGVADSVSSADSAEGSGSGTGGVSAADLAKQESKVDRLGGMTQSLLWVAIALHLASIVLRGLAVNRFPLGNLYEYMMMITFGALLAMMIAMQRKEWRTLWPWVVTPLAALRLTA